MIEKFIKKEIAKERLATLVCPIFRLYFRKFPLQFGKLTVWNKIVHKYLLWRPVDVVSVTEFGARFPGRLGTPLHGFLYFFGVFEPALTSYMRNWLRLGDVAIDVGANIGVHTVLLSRLVGPTGRVHAVEASPSIFARLKENLTRNGADNVVVHNVAVLDAPGTVSVFLHEASNEGGTTVVQSEAERRDTSIEAIVAALPLDQIVPAEDLRRTRLIKIDVEGAEWLVTRGMRSVLPTLADCAIIMEVTPTALADFGASVDALVAVFSEYGYRAFRFPDTFNPQAHMRPAAPLTPLTSTSFDIADLLFVRQG